MKNRLVGSGFLVSLLSLGSLVALVSLVSGGGCSRAPTLLVTVDSIPPMAQSLAVQTTNNMLEAVMESSPYDLPLPAPMVTSFLLQLGNLSAGSVGASVAAYSQPEGKGCLLATGGGSDAMFMGPDDNLHISLTPVTDSACAGETPTLLTALPALASTSGGDTIALSGWGFQPDSVVNMGSKPGEASYVSAAALNVTTPAHAGFGPTPIRVANRDGTFVTRSDLFRFYSPTPAFTGVPFQSSASFNQSSGFVIAHLDPMTQIDAAFTFPASNVVRVLYTVNSQVDHQIDYNVGNYPGPMVSADFNGDGHPDIIVANINDGTAQLLLNSGDGTLTVMPAFSVGTSASMPSALATGDFNGDGLPDLAVANKADNQVVVFINQGGGTMRVQAGQQPLNIGGRSPVSLSVGDLDQDKLLDIAVAEYDPTSSNPSDYRVAVFFNQGGGLFDTRSTHSVELTVSAYNCTHPTSILLSDTNSDGIPDLVVSCGGTNQVLVLLYMGSVSIRQIVLPTEAMPGRAAIADVNGDGFGDIVVPCSGPALGTVDIFLNKLGAGFDNQQYLTQSASCAGANQVALVDLMTNGHLDIAVGGIGCIGLLLNQSN